MRRFGFTTLVDPFEARFGRTVGGRAVGAGAWRPRCSGAPNCSWRSASTFGVLLGMRLHDGHPASRRVVVTAYTMVGGMWSVAYTDALAARAGRVGLAVALPYVARRRGRAGRRVAATTGPRARSAAACCRRFGAHGGFWTRESLVGWWDVSLMLIFGGIPWNCYFQRVLSCRTPARAQWHSILSGLLTIALTAPPLLFGRGRVRLRVASPTSAAQLQPPAGRHAAAAVASRSRRRWSALLGHGRHHRRRDVELQLVDPVGRLDVQLEHLQAPAVAVPVGDGQMKRDDPAVDLPSSAGRRR